MKTSQAGPLVSASGVLWTPRYAALLGVVLLAYSNQNALLPVIPLYVASIGGSELGAGIVLAVFSVTSFAVRPRIGRLVDEWDAGRVLLAGCVLLAASTTGMVLPGLVVLALANASRGLAWAAVNTGSHVGLARLAPPHRRGEASGYFSLAQAAAAAVGPPVAIYWLARTDDYGSVFIGASVAALAAAIGATRLRETGISLTHLLRNGPPKRSRTQIVARSAVLPSALVMLVMVSQPAVLGFVPLYAAGIGINASTVTLFYVFSGIAALLGRSLLGRLSDGNGRGSVLLVGYTLMGLSLVGLSLARSGGQLLAIAVSYSLGQGMALPAITSLAITRAEQAEIGAAMATYSASFQVALGAGGLLAGALIGGLGYGSMYLLMAASTVAGGLVAIQKWSDLRPPTAPLARET